MCAFKDFLEKSLCFFDICKEIEPVYWLFAVNTAVKSQADELLIRYDTIYMPVAGNKQFGGISNAQR